jgi:hypothetical protein
LLDVTVEKGVFTPEQINKLLAVADSDWRGLILAGYYTGARLGDLARLTWQSIDLAERSIAFTQKKTGTKIKIPIHSELLDYLLSRSVPDDERKPVFPKLYHLRGSGQTGLSSSFRRLMDRAGIEGGIARQKTGDAGRNVSLLSFHSLRHPSRVRLQTRALPQISDKSSQVTPMPSRTKSIAITSFPPLPMRSSGSPVCRREMRNEQRSAFGRSGSRTGSYRAQRIARTQR